MSKYNYLNDTKSVKVREKNLTNGKKSLFLDYYHNGKHEYEFLKLYLYPEHSVVEKKQNKETRGLVEEIQVERSKAIDRKWNGLNHHSISNILLSDWVEKCAEKAEKRVAEDSHRNSWARMLRQTNDLLADYTSGRKVKLTEVNKAFVKGFIEYLQDDYVITRGCTNKGEHLSPKSAHKKYSCLRFVLNEAVRDDLIQTNPCNQLSSTEKIVVPESTREYLTEEELRKLETTPTKSAVRNPYLFMCCCGLRISDLKRLRWSNFEKDGNRLKLRIRQKKTNSPLYLPLSDMAQSYLPEQGEKSSSCLIFDNLPTEPALNRSLKKWVKAAGITKNITLHTARHTFATLLLTKGADLYTTSKLLGHKNIGTTQIYAKIIDKKKEDAVSLLNGLF